MIYYELEKRNMKRMSKVLAKGSIGAVFTYVIVGIFGYLIFVNRPESFFNKKNILDVDDDNFRYNPAIMIVLIKLN